MADDDIVLKLVIKGQDPSEITRLANETAGRLADESAKHIGKMTDLHKKAAQDRENTTKETADSEIKAILRVEAQHKSSMDATLERMKNVTIIAQGLVSAFKAQANAAFQLGEDIDRLTNVYGSLKGSIDEMRTATAGEVSDYDLITTKNRAMLMDLKLTDQQFGIVAKAADNFADTLGTNTKEALDQLIEGLATGRTKTLEHAGAIKDVDAVYEAFAKKLGTTADKLTDNAKRTAVIEEALRNLDKKNKESGEIVDNFSHRWEVMSASIKNLADSFKLNLGEAIMYVVHGLGQTADLLDLMKARFKDIGGSGNFDKAARDIAMRDEDKKNRDALFEHYINRTGTPDDVYKYNGGGAGLIKKPKAPGLGQIYYPDYNRPLDENGDEYQRTRAGQYEKDQALLDIIGSTDYQHRMGGMDSGDMDAAYQKAANRTGHSPFDQSMGFNADKLAEQMAKVQPRIDQLKKEAGERGIFGMLMFGPDGPDQLYSEMDEFQKVQSDMADMLTETAHKMAEAGAASLAAWTANASGAKKSMRDVTNELAIALSTEAYLKGLEAVAKAIGFAVDQDYASAEQSLAEAAAWGALGVAAGLGARAIGHSVPSSTGTGTSTKTGSAGGYGGYTKSSTSSGNNSPLTINLSVFPGGEAEAGRQINKALDAYYSQTGKGARAAA